MVWFLVWMLVDAAFAVLCGWAGVQWYKRRMLKAQQDQLMAETDGAMPDATVIVHILAPDRCSIQTHTGPVFDDQPKYKPVLVAAQMLSNAVPQIAKDQDGIDLGDMTDYEPHPNTYL